MTLDHVRPGDLITAEQMNRLLDEINSLDTRVATLENGAGAGNAVQITSIIPAGGIGMPIRVNDELQILGLNFGYSKGAQRVYFDNKRVDEYRVGSSDTRLVVPVPSLPDLPNAGRLVVLRVENGPQFDTQNITVLPILQTLTGDVDVIWLDIPGNPDPNPVVPSQSATFAYQLRSRANLTALYTITPTVTVMSGTVPAGLANPQVLDGSRNNIASRQVSLDPGQTRSFFIRIQTVPSGTNGLAFNLNVSAGAGGISGSDQRPFIVGTPVEPSDPAIQLVVSNFEPATNFNDSTNEIRLNEGVIGTMNYLATFTDAGTYHITFELSAGSTNWEVGPGDTPLLSAGVYGYTETNPNVTENAQFKVRANSGASSTGQVIFTVKRAGQTIGQTRRYNLVLLP
jgi:hypothetical protein